MSDRVEDEVPPSKPQTAGKDAAVLALFDVLGRRWALRVLWELRAGGMTYRELAARVPDMSTSVLTQRLRDLRDAGLAEHHHGAGYRVTPHGRELLAHLERLRDWAAQVNFAEWSESAQK
jgi:DNA-binding HxlR family transcriptional regulator